MATINGTTNNNLWTYKLEVSEDSYSVENNTSNVTVKVYLGRASSRSYIGGGWTGSVTVDGYTHNISGTIPYPTYIDGGAWYEIASTTYSGIGHNTDGTKTIPVSSTMSSNVFTPSYCSASGNVTLTTIPRKAEITSAPDFNDENSPTIYYSNKAGNSVTSLQARIENSNATSVYAEYRDINKTGTSYTFNLTNAERNVLRSACSNSNYLTVKFVIKTVIGGNTFWSTVDKTMSIVNAKPTFSNSQLSYLDSNSTIVAITENNQHIVRNQSNLKVTYTGATANKGASISRYEITFNGGTQTKTSAATIDYGMVNLSNNSTVSVKAVDSRGNSTTISKTIQIKDWILPSAVITANRVNNYEDETHLKASVTISSVNNKNAIQSIKYRYKKTGTSTYSSYVSMTNNVQSTLTIDKLYAWNFQIVVADKFGSTTYNFVVPKGMPIMFIDVDKIAVGINSFPSANNSFNVAGTLFVNNIQLQANASSTISGGIKTRLSGNILYITNDGSNP